MNVSYKIDDKEVRRIAGRNGIKRVENASADGIRDALTVFQRHHKRNEFISRGSRLTGPDRQPAHPTKLTNRTRNLSRSYMTKLDKKNLVGIYGSNSDYAAVHEFGSAQQHIPARPTLQRTITATKEKIEKILADSVQKGLDRA